MIRRDIQPIVPIIASTTSSAATKPATGDQCASARMMGVPTTSTNTPDPNTPDLVTPETGEPDPVLAWTAMRDWLADSVAGIPAGGVLDLGPAEYDDSDDAGDVPCAQILVLRDQTFMVRLSTH